MKNTLESLFDSLDIGECGINELCEKFDDMKAYDSNDNYIDLKEAYKKSTKFSINIATCATDLELHVDSISRRYGAYFHYMFNVGLYTNRKNFYMRILKLLTKYKEEIDLMNK